jgi:hypothetical protein
MKYRAVIPGIIKIKAIKMKPTPAILGDRCLTKVLFSLVLFVILRPQFGQYSADDIVKVPQFWQFISFRRSIRQIIRRLIVKVFPKFGNHDAPARNSFPIRA